MKWLTNWNSESGRWARSVDLTAVIGGRGTPYPCPDISAVDQHIGQLYKRIDNAACWLPELVQELWADIDMLLDHRMLMELDRAGIPVTRARNTTMR